MEDMKQEPVLLVIYTLQIFVEDNIVYLRKDVLTVFMMSIVRLTTFVVMTILVKKNAMKLHIAQKD